MANPRKNDNVLSLAGTYRKDRHGDKKEKPEWNESAPTPPKQLKCAALREWKRLIKVTPVGVITQTDRALLGRYCHVYGIWEDSLSDDDAPKIGAGLYTEMRLMEKELGFTPSSRGSIGGKHTGEKGSGPQKIPR